MAHDYGHAGGEPAALGVCGCRHNIEVFFDLVYAFAVTQLSHYVFEHATAEGALQTALLLSMVWVVLVVHDLPTNWLDPMRLPSVGLDIDIEERQTSGK
jgi:hypothetical protein